MKKFLSIFIVVLLAVLLFGCGNNSTDAGSPNAPTENVQNVTNEPPSPTQPPDEDSIAVQNGNGLRVGEGRFVIGDWINEGQYTVTGGDDFMEVIVFTSEEYFNDFDNAPRLTMGDHSRAVEQFALFSTWLNESETAFISLKNGYVLKIIGGNGVLNEVSLYLADTSDILPGVFFIGDDIREGQYSFTVTSADWGINLVIFESKDHYISYFRSRRFTMGEERDATEANAREIRFLGENDSYMVFLREGNILMLSGGIGYLEKQS